MTDTNGSIPAGGAGIPGNGAGIPGSTVPLVLTAGYAGRQPRDLRRLAEGLDAMVIDCRLSPLSRQSAWRKSALIGVLGTRYLWVPDFGNLNYKSRDDKNGGPIQIKDFDAGLRLLDSLGLAHEDADGGSAASHIRPRPRRVILLCACRDASACHRAVLAGLFRGLGFESAEVDWDWRFAAAGGVAANTGTKMAAGEAVPCPWDTPVGTGVAGGGLPRLTAWGDDGLPRLTCADMARRKR